MRAVSALLLILLAAAARGADPVPSTDNATMGALAVPPAPSEERSRAFTGPVHFHSKGTIKALLIKMDRDLRIAMEPVREGGRLTAVDTTVVDVAHGNKRYHGVLPLTARGTLMASEPHLINATNIWSITPEIREKLKAGGGPIRVPGRVDTDGELRGVMCTHRFAGLDADGLVQVETATESNDGELHFKTLITLAADGLPLHGVTTGTIKKGPVEVDVNVHLTRE